METLSTAAAIPRVIEKAQDKKVIMIGEASHGTSEFYSWRAQITKALIQEFNVDFVGVEGDWPACRAFDRYVHGETEDVHSAVDTFGRWPTWMWANWETVAFIEWLKKENSGGSKTSFYGLDVYSLYESITEIINYLEKHDIPIDADRFTQCFSPIGNEKELLRKLSVVPQECEDEVTELLTELRSHELDREGFLDAEINAEIVASAREYYKAMIHTDSSWNVRDRHMFRMMQKLEGNGKIIIWAHNTHVGDARFTDMKDNETINIGQLGREEYGDEVLLIGQSTYRGSVIAGSSWGAPMQNMNVPEARQGSWDELLQKKMPEGGMLDCRSLDSEWNGQRAIGVVYRPAIEQFGNYVPTDLSQRYDLLYHIPVTKALHPVATGTERKTPETYPFGV